MAKPAASKAGRSGAPRRPIPDGRDVQAKWVPPNGDPILEKPGSPSARHGELSLRLNRLALSSSHLAGER
jgi:hypothetical protein